MGMAGSPGMGAAGMAGGPGMGAAGMAGGPGMGAASPKLKESSGCSLTPRPSRSGASVAVLVLLGVLFSRRRAKASRQSTCESDCRSTTYGQTGRGAARSGRPRTGLAALHRQIGVNTDRNSRRSFSHFFCLYSLTSASTSGVIASDH
jgi:hypothetical protein